MRNRNVFTAPTFIAACALAALLVWSSAACAQGYVERLRGKTLSEGVGVEGVLTVYDETPRMFRSLGTPRTDAKYPLWYFYDEGPFKLTVQAAFSSGKFKIKAIQYSADRSRPPALRTSTGITLGDRASQVSRIYGPAPVVKGTEHRYPSRGIAFHLGGNSGTVIGITVFKTGSGVAPAAPTAQKPAGTPAAQPTKPLTAAPVRAAPTRSPTSPPTGRPARAPDATDALSGPAALGLAVPRLGWRLHGPPSSRRSAFLSANGALRLRMERCDSCSEGSVDWLRRLEAKHGPNRLPLANRQLTPAEAQQRGAVSGVAGRFDWAGAEQGPVWALALTRGTRTTRLLVELRERRPSDETTAALVKLLTQLGLRAANTAP